MKLIRVYTKMLAVLLIIGMAIVAYGREKLVAFERGTADNIRTTEKISDNANNTNAKIENNKLYKCRKAIKSSEYEKIPFLVNGIKYSCIESNETIVFSNFNQKLEYFMPLSLCVFYSYDCPIDASRHSRSECEQLAREAVYSVFSSFKNFIITQVELSCESDKVCTFAVMTTLTGDKKIKISLRKDTGSVVLYDAREVIYVLLER